MKVFISWSGPLSKSIAHAVRDWLPVLFSGVEFFVSDVDIDKGVRSTHRLSEELENSNCGIICITASNIDRPWILFEAGALSKISSIGKVLTLLIDIDHGEIPLSNPLRDFQATAINQDDIWRLVLSINKSLCSDASPVENETVLRHRFDLAWPNLNDALDSAISKSKEDSPSVSKPSSGALVREVYDLVLAQRSDIEAVREMIEALVAFQRQDGESKPRSEYMSPNSASTGEETRDFLEVSESKGG